MSDNPAPTEPDLDMILAQRDRAALDQALQPILDRIAAIEARLSAPGPDNPDVEREVTAFEGEFLVALSRAADPAAFVAHMRSAIVDYNMVP